MFRKLPSFEATFQVPVVVYTLFVAWNIAGLSWALNFQEALADCAKTMLGWLTFVCVIIIHQQSGELLIKQLAKSAIASAIILFSVFVWQLWQVGDFEKESMYSVTGLNGHKNLFSSFIFLNCGFLLYARNSLPASWKNLLTLAIILDVIIIAVLRTKAVYIGSACALLFFATVLFIAKRKYKRAAFILAGIIFLIVINIFFWKILPAAIDQSLNLTADKSSATLLSLIDEERLQLWKKSYHIITNYPVAGTGPGNWQVFFPDATLTGIWRAEDLNFTFQRPHNDLLWILCETGYAGLNLWLLFLISLCLFAVHRLQRTTDENQKKQVIVLMSVLVGFIVMSFFDFPKERIEHLAWFGIIAAIICRGEQSLQKSTIKANLNELSAALFVFSLLVFTAGILRYSGEFYTRKLYDDKSAAIHARVIKNGSKAKNVVYSLDPTSVPISWYTGNAYASLGDYEKAYAEFQTAYEEHRYNRNVLNDLGSALIYKADTLSAIKFYIESARISPRYDEPRLNLAAINISRKRFSEADKWLRSILHDSERRTKYQKYVDLMLSQEAGKPQ